MEPKQNLEPKQILISSLKPDPRNARRHPEENLKQIERSLQRHGQAVPIVIDPQLQVVSGNGTLEAAKRLGWKEIACVTYDGDPAACRALALEMNRTAELAEWNLSNLEATIVELSAEGMLPEDLGFTDADLDNLFPPALLQETEPFRTDAPDIETTAQDKPAPLLQYALIFDTEDQERCWHAWLKDLATEYPSEKTAAGRLARHIEQEPTRVPETK